MPYSDKEKRIAYLKEYRKLKGLTRSPKRERTKEEVNAYNRNHYHLHKSRLKEHARLKHLKLKIEVMTGYGGKCVLCGETEIEFLTLDHVNNDGNVTRKNNMYGWAIKNGFPKSLQCLCFSCNWKKELEIRPKGNSIIGKIRSDARRKVINHYGAECSCCQEKDYLKLAIDHVDGGGCKDRRITRGKYNSVYSEIIQAGFPPSFRVLCHNCNHSARVGKGHCIHNRLKMESRADYYRLAGILNKLEDRIDLSEETFKKLKDEHGDSLPSFLADVILECNLPPPEKVSSEDHALSDFRRLMSETCYIEKNQRVGLVSSNHFHESSMWKSPLPSGESPHDLWRSRKTLLTVCRGIRLAENHGITNTNLRRYFLLNVGLPSQFRPAVAKALYEKYASGGRVFDPCSGWGDRLAGFWASSAVEYVGVDPNSSLPEGYEGQRKMYSTVVKKKCTMIQSGIEDVKPEDVGEFDFGFTSPPYFMQEKYSKDKDQSHIRWNTYPLWRDNFLRHLVEIMSKTCKVFSININDVGGFPLVQDTIDIATSLGATLIDTHKYMLPRRPSDKSGEERFEPILVFST